VINKNITLVSNDIYGMSIEIENLAGFGAEQRDKAYDTAQNSLISGKCRHGLCSGSGQR